ncbi:hypothetical protein [Microvirga tunisiensis]|uniref:hypothetical protein n=1 Tax=Microvirga tunisiensis TaxID=2108360 RepID=UPI00129C29D4|nr:hypothetical protein [Microvirga tunisiensis]
MTVSRDEDALREHKRNRVAQILRAPDFEILGSADLWWTGWKGIPKPSSLDAATGGVSG